MNLFKTKKDEEIEKLQEEKEYYRLKCIKMDEEITNLIQQLRELKNELL